MLGKCDCYVVVSSGGIEKKTNRVDKDYDPNFDETFQIEVADRAASLTLKVGGVADRAASHLELLKGLPPSPSRWASRDSIIHVMNGLSLSLPPAYHLVQVFDFNRAGKDELIGRVTVPIGKLSATEQLEGMYRILGSGGAGVKGHSGKDARLLVRIVAQPSTQSAHNTRGGATGAAAGGAASVGGGLAGQVEGAEGEGDTRDDFEAFVIGVKCVEGRHMPKMDAFGKCDAYCVLTLGGADRAQTKPHKNTYSPVWNDDFDFAVSP